jgi:small multidrug resistance pump
VTWAILFVAIGVEVTASSSLPRTDGFRNPGWSLLVVAGYVLSIWMLTLVVREIPVSVAYAVWAGLGTAGVAVVGYLVLGEAMTPVKALALALIVAGVALLNLTGAAHH